MSSIGCLFLLQRKGEKTMSEKVNPSHPDKLCDRIAGVIVDRAYEKEEDPRIAVEVLLGHGMCHIIAESSVHIQSDDVRDIVHRIAGKNVGVDYKLVPQDVYLANNQEGKIRCGDSGIFKGVPVTEEQKKLAYTAELLYTYYPYDGKYIIDGDRLIICQSNADSMDIMDLYPAATINPLGRWTGGPDVDTGATNRKLGSDMGDSVTGGGLHGKDLSKADVSLNIYCWLKAQETGQPFEISCAIGDETIDGFAYQEYVDMAKEYIGEIGGFEKFAEWGLVR